MPLFALLQPGFRTAAAALVLAGMSTPTHAGVDLAIGLNFPIGHYNNGHWGSVYGTLPRGAVNVQIGGGGYWRHGGIYYRPWGPQWVVVAPPVMLAEPMLVHAAPAVLAEPTRPPVPSRPDPVIYPRNGQSAQQTEADRQDCNRWATTQPAALADASVFHRSVEACMDGRGYTLK